jgi:hypothetical protein
MRSARRSAGPARKVYWVVDQVHGDVLVVGAEGHGAFAAQPGGEFFVGADETVAAHGQDDGAQFVDDFVGALGFGGDGRVEADERLAQVGFDEDVLRLAGDGARRHEMPSRTAAAEAGGGVGGGLLNDAWGDGLLWSAQEVTQVGFDGG